MTYRRRPGRGPLLVAACVAAGVFFGGFTLLERMQARGVPPPAVVVLVVTRDIAAYDSFYKRLIACVPLKNVSSHFSMERVKFTTALPLAQSS